MLFPWLSYNDWKTYPPKHIPVCYIYTMNSPNNPDYLEPIFRQAEQSVDYFLHDKERVCAYNTLQVRDYSKFDLDGFSHADKQKWHNEL